MTDKILITNLAVRTSALNVCQQLACNWSDCSKPMRLYGIPRGGIPALYAVLGAMRQVNSRITTVLTEFPSDADFIIDDIFDSGATAKRYAKEYGRPVYVLFDKRDNQYKGKWLVMPWEQADEDQSADDIPTRLLQFVGEDPTRGGLVETPKRFLKAWKHYTSGYGQDPKDILKVFEDGAEKYDEMVLVKSIPVYSHCEHHLALFFGVAHLAYIPDGNIVGLSKLSRLVDMYSRRLQVQERLTSQIADALEENLKPKGVAVVLDCRHSCMEARGIQRQGSSTITSSMRGAFMNSEAARVEFMGLIK